MAVIEYTKEGKIAIFTLNRPEALNAQNYQLRKELSDALADFRDDRDLWVGIITGAGERAFSAGADIREFGQPQGATALEAPKIRPDLIWKPVIAAINGFALGGGLELAMHCDIRIAADHARMGQPEVKIGFMPGWGGTQRLPRLIPRAKAAEMLLTGEPINAEEAYRVGLVNKVVPLKDLMPTAMAMAQSICEKGPLGVQKSKEAMMRGLEMSLEEGLKLESELATWVGATEDFREGTRAFAEKRKPDYQGK